MSSFEILKTKARHNPVTYWFDNAADLISHVVTRLLPEKERAKPARILVYPGKFDPFHLTHLQEVQGALDELDFDQAVVMPTPGQPGSQAKNRAPAWLRMALIQVSTKDDSRIVADHLGLRQDIRVAPELMASFREKVGKEAEISLLMGADNFKALPKWDELETFLADVNLVVNSRPGYDLGDWQAALPGKLGGKYQPDGERRFVNQETGKSIEFIDVKTGGFGSGAVIGALKENNSKKLHELMAPGADTLVREHFYPNNDYNETGRQYEIYDVARPLMLQVFGKNLGPKLAQDADLLIALRKIPLDTGDTTSALAGTIFDCARAHAERLSDFPTLYSDAVKAARDPKLLKVVAQTSLVEPNNALSARRQNSEAEWLKPLTNSLQWFRKKTKPILSDLLEAAVRLKETSTDDEALPVRSAPLLEPFDAGETIRIYVGIKPHVDIDHVREHGMLSKADRSQGRDEVDERITSEGEASAIMGSMFGKDDVVAHISTSLSQSVAESYAPAGGHVLVADVPAASGKFLNDPQLWAGTALRDVGNPESFLAEFVTRDIKPEWITEIRPAPTSRGPAVAQRQSKYVGAYLKALLPLARNLFSSASSASSASSSSSTSLPPASDSN